MNKWLFHCAPQILLAIQALLIWIAVIKKQKFGLWLLLSGIAVFILLAGTVCLLPLFPHQNIHFNIYLVFFVSVMLTLAGLIGLLTKLLTNILRKIISHEKDEEKEIE